MSQIEIDATVLVHDAVREMQKTLVECQDCGCVTLNGIPVEEYTGVRCAPCFAQYHYKNREEWLKPLRKFEIDHPELEHEGMTIASQVESLIRIANEALESRKAQKEQT